MTQTHRSLTLGPRARHGNGTRLQGGPLQHGAEHYVDAFCPISAQGTAHLHRTSGTAASIACFPVWHEPL